MDIAGIIEKGHLVSPGNRKPLSFEGDNSALTDGTNTYGLYDGRVPILLSDSDWADSYVKDADRMLSEYSQSEEDYAPPQVKSSKATLYTDNSHRVQSEFFDSINKDDLALSVGGGPIRFDPKLTNVNIQPFPNVDVVGDAHDLPFADNVVDYAFAGAVFEHLHSPHIAAAELYRTLKPGGKALMNSPFAFVYHGYPHHYQNFTITGHCELFKREGFRVLDSGVSVGPGAAITQLMNHFIDMYTSGVTKFAANSIWRMLAPLIRRVDRNPANMDSSHFLAACTYVLVEK